MPDCKERGIEFWKQNRHSDAEVEFTYHLIDHPEDVDVLLLRSVAHMNLGQHQRSLEDACAATRLQPDSYKAHVRVAAALENLDDCEGAIDALTKAVALNSDSNVARDHLRRLEDEQIFVEVMSCIESMVTRVESDSFLELHGAFTTEANHPFDELNGAFLEATGRDVMKEKVKLCVELQSVLVQPAHVRRALYVCYHLASHIEPEENASKAMHDMLARVNLKKEALIVRRKFVPFDAFVLFDDEDSPDICFMPPLLMFSKRRRGPVVYGVPGRGVPESRFGSIATMTYVCPLKPFYACHSIWESNVGVFVFFHPTENITKLTDDFYIGTRSCGCCFIMLSIASVMSNPTLCKGIVTTFARKKGGAIVWVFPESLRHDECVSSLRNKLDRTLEVPRKKGVCATRYLLWWHLEVVGA